MSEWQNCELPFYYTRNAESYFFEAMLQSYASDNGPTALPAIPGAKQYRSLHEGGRIVVVDTYIVPPEGIGSHGMTVMAYHDEPIWAMSYAGRYPEAAIPVLKEALRVAYQSTTWHGGRGIPYLRTEDGWVYTNHSQQPDSFFNFSGEERVYRPNGTLAGFHHYNGQWLVNHHLDPRKR